MPYFFAAATPSHAGRTVVHGDEEIGPLAPYPALPAPVSVRSRVGSGRERIHGHARSRNPAGTGTSEPSRSPRPHRSPRRRPRARGDGAEGVLRRHPAKQTRLRGANSSARDPAPRENRYRAGRRPDAGRDGSFRATPNAPSQVSRPLFDPRHVQPAYLASVRREGVETRRWRGARLERRRRHSGAAQRRIISPGAQRERFIELTRETADTRLVTAWERGGVRVGKEWIRTHLIVTADRILRDWAGLDPPRNSSQATWNPHWRRPRTSSSSARATY